MRVRELLSLTLLLVLLTALTDAAGGAPLAGPCVPAAAYDSACDANQDGHITITDSQLAAGHWNQNGAFVSDNNHTHLGQTWAGANNSLKIQGAFGAPDYTPLLLSNSTGHGLAINSAAQDGVYVGTAGTPSSSSASTDSNGFKVAGAQLDGLNVCRQIRGDASDSFGAYEAHEYNAFDVRR